MSKTDEELPPRIFLLLENPKKSNNLGPILRCAAAFAVTQVVVVGYDKCNTEGSHGASKHVEMVAFPALYQAVEYLRLPLDQGGCGCTSVMGMLSAGAGAFDKEGYETRVKGGLVSVANNLSTSSELPKSYPVHTNPFQRGGNFCIVLSKNWKGLPASLAEVCDLFVHVPHSVIVSEETEARLLLDAPSCLSITLHHLTQFMGYDERVFQGHKFEVAFVQKGRLNSFQPKRGKSRKEVKEENRLEAEMADATALGNIFGESGDYDY